MRLVSLPLVLSALMLASAAPAGEIGFTEDFALAKDREAALKKLIPGTQEYYYYHCLHYQNTGQLDKVDEVLQAWIARYKRTGQVVEIENRQALLRYPKAHKASLDYIQRQLGLHFNHQKESLDRKPNLPTSLDAKLISRETLTQRALAHHPGTVQGFEDGALEWAAGLQLDGDRRRHLLSRLVRPDVPNLPAVVAEDLAYKNSRPFGSMPIHAAMLLSQLTECLKLKADLINETAFVHIYLTKLQPGADSDWRYDAAERQAYLERLWAFVSRLAPAFNSLKAHVLYHRLVHDRSAGVYDKDRFMLYLKLPRPAVYINPDYLKRDENRGCLANLGVDFRTQTLLGPVGDDEPLVRSYLMHFFVEENTFQPYEEYVRDTYLRPVFAETKITHGLGDMEKWYSLISPGAYKALAERVDLDFAYTNKPLFAAEEPVALDVHVKNVKSLIVKVYEINALNYYRDNLREVDTDIQLDGLVASEEKVHTYTEIPQRRVVRHFEFPALKARGLYVVELIGNGKSSRALIRKGRLHYLLRTSAAGQAFTVLDESNRPVDGASLWLAGHQYEADKDGIITVPFTNKPQSQQIVLISGNQATLASFPHEAERYSLDAGIHVDRESLLTRKTAKVIVRPVLHLNGEPVGLSLLEEPALVITSIDHDNVATTKEVKDFKLHEDRESSYEFQVPARLGRISFTLKGKVQNLSQAKKLDLASSASFTLNQIDKTEKVQDLHLGRADGRYFVDLLGRTGEAEPDRPVKVVIKHRDFRDVVEVMLQTDAAGRVTLGELTDIDWISAAGPEGTEHRWPLVRDRHNYPAAVQSTAAVGVAVPFMEKVAKLQPGDVSLLELRGGTYAADWFKALTLKDGMLLARGLPAGDYELRIKRDGATLRVRLTAGQLRDGYALSETRLLEVRDAKPLQIASVSGDKDAVRIRLVNATEFARVHMIAARYMPEYSIFADLDRVGFPGPHMISLGKAISAYIAGRDIGDEYRYILDRKYAQKFPGNMLTRPGLLLNPWAIRKTETAVETAKLGTAFGRSGAAPSSRFRGAAEGGRTQAAGQFFANLDFLAQASVVLVNLRPDKNGTITIARKDLGDQQQIHVVAVDPDNTVYRELSLAEVKGEMSNLRLVLGLDPARHFAEKHQATVVPAGGKLTLADVTTSRFEAYDSLARAYGLYATLSSNPTLVEFGFLLNWPKLKDDERRKLYSKYACHELSFFLYKKDPAFFEQVILPYLKNKKDKTFLDEWLIGADVAGYLKPWAHERLNIVEQVLLGRRIAAERAAAKRYVTDVYDLIPPNRVRLDHLFQTAMKAGSLEVGDKWGLQKAREGAEQELRLRAATPAAPAVAPPSEALANGRLAAAPAKKAAEAVRKLKEVAKGEEVLTEALDADKDGKSVWKADEARRYSVRQLYRKLDKTQEWAENNYYHLPIEQQNAELVKVNAFWRDWADLPEGQAKFLSTHFAEASGSFTEMMLALAVLDLPFEPAEHQTAAAGASFTLTAGSDMIVFYKEIAETQPAAEKTPILVSQNYFRQSDPYRFVNNERLDKYVTDEFLIQTVYGCQVVITNPTSSRQKLDVLLQVPRGSIPVLNGQYTRGLQIDLEPYSTQKVDYFFYFPSAGQLDHYPVHVAKDERIIAFCPPTKLNVVEKLSKIDRTSWDYVSQYGTTEETIDFLKGHNIERINLDRVAWRMGDKGVFEAVIGLLTRRHAYNQALWSYGIRHDDAPAIREYLKHCEAFVNQCGPYIDSELLTIDPVERLAYQHLEYSPLVNARAHQLGSVRRILNDRFSAQYERLMSILCCRATLEDDDLMAVTYYLLLQDRVAEGSEFFSRVKPDRLATRLQYDYFTVYTAVYRADTQAARQVAERYARYGVDRWRELFAGALAQLDEIEGKAVKVVDPEDRAQVQTRLAATEASFDFTVEAGQIKISYQNLDRCRVNYYLMDIELLFSRNPLLQQYSGAFAYVRPNLTQDVKLPADKTGQTIDLPPALRKSNVMVEIVAGGVKKSHASTSTAMAVQVMENYGQLKVTQAQTGKPLAKVYVKVYADLGGGVGFYKDGYTDLRGRFDYTSLNTDELDRVQKFSILVLSETDGAVVREAAPPKR